MTTLTPEQIAYVAGSPEGGGFSGADLVESIAVALAESEGVTDAVSPPNSDEWRSEDRGLWQINDHWHADLLEKHDWSNPYANAGMARIIHDQAGGWSPWSTYPGKAAAHLGRARTAAANPVPPPNGPDTTGGTVHDAPTHREITNPVSEALQGIATQVGRVAALFDGLLWITHADNIRRVLVGTAGAVLILSGVLLLGRQAVREGT